MKRSTRAIGVALSAALAAGLWWASASTPTGSEADALAGTDASTQADADAARDAGANAATNAKPGSLRGTEFDGEVRFATDGSVIPDAGLRRLFDHVLSTMGETDLAGVRNLLRSYLQSRFDTARTERVLAVFDRYVAYQRALLEAPGARSTDPAVRLAEARRLRRSLLGDAMAEGFFAEEEALAELSLKRRDIVADPKLSADRKRELLDALDREAGYDARGDAEVAELAARQAEDIERRGLTATQRQAERSALWGPEAAERLAVLDAQQADWDARVLRYIEARNRMQQDPRLTPAQREQNITALRAAMFSAPEQRRVVSLEAIGQLQAALSTPR
ncbi:lipase secretion chaperone [Lysobacter brunescens]|uniref:Lipase chaperone n=1 Tax=Lysobacter brunescens TaxID=262323 RepID=A0ABW2YB38_9GAMM